jgi:hypothetical protein
MLPVGCKAATVVAQPGMGTASRAAAVVVWPFPTPGRLPLFSTVTGRCLDACSSHYICSSTVTARHHFRPPDFSKQFREKKSDIVNFLKSLEFWRNIMYQMMQLKMHAWLAILYFCQEMVPSSQQPSEGGCWAPFSYSWGLKQAPRAPVREHVIPFNPDGHLPVARGGHSCSPPGALRAHTSNRSHAAEEKLYCRWKITERCHRLATFFNGPPPTFRKF